MGGSEKARGPEKAGIEHGRKGPFETRARGPADSGLRRWFLGHALLMAVQTFHKVNVVAAGASFEGRIHLLDIQAAVGHLRMTSGAGSPGLLPVVLVAGQATDSFVDSHRRAIVSAAHLGSLYRCVALIAERLSRIGTRLDHPLPFLDPGQRQQRERDVLLRTPIVKRQRGHRDRLIAAG
jgi:hypothetical protein